MLTGSHLQAFISLQAAWMNCSVGPLGFPLVPFFPLRRCRCAGHNAQLPFHKSQLCSQVHLSKKCAPHAIKCTELVVGSKLPAATHYTLQQRTSVVKGARDPRPVISTSVTLRSAPVRTGAFSLHTHQWKPSFETGQDWTSGSLWTDTLSQQTWPPPPYLTVLWNRKINSPLILSVDTAGTFESLAAPAPTLPICSPYFF